MKKPGLLPTQEEKKDKKMLDYMHCHGNHSKSWEECSLLENLSMTITISVKDMGGVSLSTLYYDMPLPSGTEKIETVSLDSIISGMQLGIVSSYCSSH